MSESILYHPQGTFLHEHKNFTFREGFAEYLTDDGVIEQWVSYNRDERNSFLASRCRQLNIQSNWVYFNYKGTSSDSKVGMKFKTNSYSEIVMTGTSIVFGIENRYWDSLDEIINKFKNIDWSSGGNFKEKICKVSSNNINVIYTAILKLKKSEKNVVGHIVYIKKAKELIITPKTVGLANNTLHTAEVIKHKTLEYISKNSKNDYKNDDDNPLYTSTVKIFSKLRLNLSTVDLDVTYLSMVKSEMMEIFSAYIVASRYSSYKVEFPDDSTYPLIDYILDLGNGEKINFSVKNEIPTISDQKEIDLYINNPNKKLRESNTNTAKVKSIFPDQAEIDAWHNDMTNRKINTMNNNLVHLVWLPGVIMTTRRAIDTNGSYPIMSINQIKNNYPNLYDNLITKIFGSSTPPFDNIINSIDYTTIYDKSITITDTKGNIETFKGKLVKIFGNHLSFIFKNETQMILDMSYIRYICEKMLIEASNTNINFIDVLKYQILDKKQIVYSIAKGHIINRNNKTILRMSFKFYDYVSESNNNDRIILRSKNSPGNRTHESLGLDIKLNHNGTPIVRGKRIISKGRLRPINRIEKTNLTAISKRTRKIPRKNKFR